MNTVTIQNTLSPLANLQDSLASRKAYRSEAYTLEWGVRTDDNALILHVYPPLVGIGGEAKLGDWTNEGLDTALTEVIAQVLDTQRVTAGFQPEENSFYIIAGGYGGVLNVRELVEHFREMLDAHLAREDAS